MHRSTHTFLSRVKGVYRLVCTAILACCVMATGNSFGCGNAHVSSGASKDSIGVHGYWKIDVKNPQSEHRRRHR